MTMQQTAANKKWGAPGAGSAGWGESSDDSAVWNQGPTNPTGWGDEPPGGGGGDIGTWHPTEAPSQQRWGQTGTGNEIIVDTKDKEAWPSIGDQSEDGGGDNADETASQKSGSVISSSSQPGQDTSDQNSLKGQGASNGWGQINNDAKDWHKDGTSAWGSALPTSASTSLGISGWGSPSPIPSLNNGQIPVTSGALTGDTTAIQDAGKDASQASNNGQSPMWPGVKMGQDGPSGPPRQQANPNSPWNISDSNSSASNAARPAGLANWPSGPGGTGWGMTGANPPQTARSWSQPSPVPSPNDIPQSVAGQPMNNASIPTSSGWSQSLDKGANNQPTAAQSGWGQLPNAAPNQPPPNWGQSTPINPAKTLSGSWAQAAGKGLQSGPTTPAPQNPQQPTRPQDPNLQVNAVQSWGLKPVKQDASWDTEISPRSKRREIESANSNVWNSQVNNGTSIWENAKTSQSKPTQIMAKSESMVQPTWNGDMNKPGWGDDQWNKPSSNDPASWNGQPDPARAPPPMGWPASRTTSSSSWDGPAPSNGAWPEQQQAQQQQQAPRGWPGPDRSISWDGASAAPGQAQSPGWDNRPPPMVQNTKWSSAKAADIKASGWDETVQGGGRASVDDGTAFWGDPSVHKQQPGWGAGSNPTTPQTPTPRMKPDGPGPWANSGPPNGDSNTWGGSSNEWNPGGKPKPSVDSLSSWGTPIDTWNKPTEPGQAWPDDVSVWGDDNNEMQENASWSSARDWNKKKTMGSGMVPPPSMSTGSMGPPPGPPGGMSGGRNVPAMRIKLLQQLMDMGFKKEDAQRALIDHNLNLESAIADLMTSVGVDNALKARGLHNDLHNDKFPVQMAIQNTQQLAQLHNQQAIANVLKQGAPSLASSSLHTGSASINPSLQQKIIQQSLLDQQRGNPAAAQSVQQQQKLLQQQQQQQILVQQLRLAVTAGLISPQTLNQPFSPQMLNILQQMLQGQAVLQRLQAQQQMVLQNKNPVTQRQQMEQVRLMTKKMESQILGLQQQLAQAQQQAFSRDGANPNKDDLSNDFPNLSIKESTPPSQSQIPSSQPATSQPQTSRLNQWKLPSPDRSDTAGDDKNKGLPHSASASNLPVQGQSKFEFTRSLSIGGDTTWSSDAVSSANDWPTSSSTTTTTTSNLSGPNNVGTGSPNEEMSRASPASNSSASTGTSNNVNTFNLNDMIPEFIPGKPWQGVANKNIEDDPHITPGSVSRSLSVNTIKDDYLNSFTSKAMAVTSIESVSSVPSPGTGNWNQRMPQPKWQPGGGNNATRPPPGIPNPKAPWSSSGAPGQQMNRGGISWAGDKSAFSAVPAQPDPRSVGSTILIIKNLTPQTDTTMLQQLSMQHGTVAGFQASHSLALVEYTNRDDAIKAQKSLNGLVLGNTTILAELMKNEPQSGVQHQQQQQQAMWQQQQQMGGGFNQPPMNYRNTAPPMKPDAGGTAHWNGASGFHGGGNMWSSGGNSPWGAGLLQGDLLGGETM